MEMLSNAVLGELVGRSISFLLSKCKKRSTTAAKEDEDDLQRLCQLLLRSGTIVEEAERRHVANRAMLRQLQALRDQTFRGHYLADKVFSSRALLQGGGDGGGSNEDDANGEEASQCAFTLSRFNPAKRVRFLSGDLRITAAALISGAESPRELQQMVRSLETMIGDMKEFLMFLASYPPLHRQPYSAHLFLDKCMFGRHMEKRMVMDFLLNSELTDVAGSSNLGVLPIIGPPLIGKSTLVHHVCQDEKVRDHFSSILVYNGSYLKDSSKMGSLIEASRSEKIARFGTTQALRLRCLSAEAYWYFFKMLVFGSDNPGQHPKMASLALEMAQVMHGSFTFAHIGAILLRAHFNSQTWSRILTRVKQYMQKNVSIIGEYPDDVKARNNRQCTWNVIKQKPDKYFMLDEIYQKGPDQEIPRITLDDLLSGRAEPKGKTNILVWKSRIPPYYNYMCTSVTRDICYTQTQ